MGKWHYWQYILLAIIILLSGLLVYKTHLSYTGEYINPYSQDFRIQGKNVYYPYPFHADEWTHMAQGIYILEESRFPDANPYSGEKRIDLESGFHLLLAGLFLIMDPIKSYQFFPAFNMMLLVLAIFLFMYAISRNYYISVLSTVFAASLKNNINIQGTWFFLPMTLGLSLLFLLLAAYFFKRYITAGTIFFITVFVYPIAAIIGLGTIILHELFQGRLKEYRYYSLGGLAAIFALMVIFRKNIPFINFEYGWTPVFEHTYVPWDIFGWAGIVFGIAGLFFLFFKKQYKKDTITPTYILLITIVPIIMYMLFRFSILIPYQRAFVYFMFGLAIISGFGLHYSCAYIKKLFNHLKLNKQISMTIISIIVATALLTSFLGYYHIDDPRFRLPHYVEDEDYDALAWINENYDKNTIMMSDIFIAYAVYPVAKIRVVAVPASNLETGNIELVYDFYYRSRDCSSKLQAMKDARAKLAYSIFPINCPGLEKVYNKKRYVYELT